MSSLRCCTFNCRGWNSGYVTLKYIIDSLDICFIQEHWLLKDKLMISALISFQPEYLALITTLCWWVALMVVAPFSIENPCRLSSLL